MAAAAAVVPGAAGEVWSCSERCCDGCDEGVE